MGACVLNGGRKAREKNSPQHEQLSGCFCAEHGGPLRTGRSVGGGLTWIFRSFRVWLAETRRAFSPRILLCRVLRRMPCFWQTTELGWEIFCRLALLFAWEAEEIPAGGGGNRGPPPLPPPAGPFALHSGPAGGPESPPQSHRLDFSPNTRLPPSPCFHKSSRSPRPGKSRGETSYHQDRNLPG